MRESIRDRIEDVLVSNGLGVFRDTLLERIMDALKSQSIHGDDIAVDRFSGAMKAKMAAAREKGRGGWDDPEQCSIESLVESLRGHLSKANPGNWVDIANFCMMLHERRAKPVKMVRGLPDDWRIVPKNPTSKMIDEFYTSPFSEAIDEEIAMAYQAMISAAPVLMEEG